MKISVIHFNDSILLGKSCEPMRAIAEGQRFEGANVRIVKYSDMFIQLNYDHHIPEKSYYELIPFARVDKLIATEEPCVSKPNEKAPSRGAKKAD